MNISKPTFIASIVIVILLTFIVTRELSYRSGGTPMAASSSSGDIVSPKSKTMTGKDGNEADPYEKEQVKNTIIKSAKSIQECYTKWLESKPQKQFANVKIDWTIMPDGKVKGAQVIESDTDVMNACLADKVNAIEFPPPPEGRSFYVAHKFSFKTEELLEKEKKEREEMERKFNPNAKGK